MKSGSGGSNFERNKLNDDHGPIDDDSEVDGPQAHKVGVYLKDVHHGERKQQTEGDHRSHYQAGPEIPQEQDDDENHDQAAQDQVFGNGIGGPFDQFTAVQKTVDINAFGQGVLNLGNPLLYPVYGRFGVGILKHHNLPEHLFSFAVGGDGSKPVGMSKADGTYIADINGGPVARFNDDIFNVLQTLNLTLAPDKIALIGSFDVSTACDVIVIFQCLVNGCDIDIQGP